MWSIGVITYILQVNHKHHIVTSTAATVKLGDELLSLLFCFAPGWVVLHLSWERPNRTLWRTFQPSIMSLMRSSSVTPVSRPRNSSASCWRRIRGTNKMTLSLWQGCASSQSLSWLYNWFRRKTLRSDEVLHVEEVDVGDQCKCQIALNWENIIWISLLDWIE